MTASATPVASGPAQPTAARDFLAAVATIMVKELRSRFRGRRAFIVLTIYLGVLALIAYGGYAVVAPSARAQAQFGGFDGFAGAANLNASATIGTAIFTLLSLFQLLLVCFIAPAFTAGAISLEREKQTLDLLVTTPLRPGAIVVGKLLSALAFVGLMILAAIPLSALVLMYGGATIDDIVRQQVVLLVTAIGFGSIGLFFSALTKRTQAATVLTYCTMLALTVGTTLLFIFWTVMNANAADNRFGVPRPAPEQLMWVNPGLAMIDVIASTESEGWGAFTTVVRSVRGNLPESGGGAEPSRPQFGRDGDVDQPLRAEALRPTTASGHFWPRFSLSFAALSLLLTLVSMRLVVPTGMRFAFRRRAPLVPPEVEPSVFGDAAIEETIE